jgi:hypothetical protein
MHGAGGQAGTQGDHCLLFSGLEGLPVFAVLGMAGVFLTSSLGATGRVAGVFETPGIGGTGTLPGVLPKRGSLGDVGCLGVEGVGIDSLGSGKIPGSFGRAIGGCGTASLCGGTASCVVIGGVEGSGIWGVSLGGFTGILGVGACAVGGLTPLGTLLTVLRGWTGRHGLLRGTHFSLRFCG